ncbi:hypothetical protein FRB90_000384 [Tulasnella sp. 427]|nr:hypothetical protein FRB90_000384 [Tulasnella sp. 427]
MSIAHTLIATIQSKGDSRLAIDWSLLELEKGSLRWSGGFADVYVASHPQLGLLALKRPRGACHPESREYRHLEKEAAIWKDLVHPNVLPFVGIYEKDDAVYMVSPFLENGTVPQYISTNPAADRARFIRDLAKGLNYLHQSGIVHGDIKGSNLLVSSTFPVEGVVADFGLAKLVDTQTVSSLQGAGTPRWQSPELMYGEPRSFQSDVYAFGMTVYEIISGKLPFDDVPYYAIFFKVHNKERPNPTPRISPSGYLYTREWDVAQAAWDHNAELRPSMDRILRMLEPLAKLQHFVEARIKVVCDEMPEYTGYVSRKLNHQYGSQVVTPNLDDALIVAWDPRASSSQVLEMLNSFEGQTWLALRFTTANPDYFNDKHLWATFTAASGVKDEFDTIWTPNSTGLNTLPTWECDKDRKMTPHALGEPLEVGLTMQPGGDPPHIFFCHCYKRYWGRVADHAAAQLVLEPIEMKQSPFEL